MPPSIEFIAMPPDPAPNRTGRHATGRWFTSARLAGSLETLGRNPLGVEIRATGDTFGSDAQSIPKALTRRRGIKRRW